MIEDPDCTYLRYGNEQHQGDDRGRGDKIGMASLEGFATGSFKNMKAEPVLLPKSPFDDVAQICVDYLDE